MTDLRWLTAICFVIIGAVLITLAFRLWFMPKWKRAIVFEPYLTTDGLRLLLWGWPVIFVLGFFTLLAGVSKWFYYARWWGEVGTDAANFVGSLEALVAIWAVGSVLFVTVRAWRGR
jgi:uncharacterized membrane-anchored protein